MKTMLTFVALAVGAGATLAPRDVPVTFIAHDQVAAAFAAGAPLIEVGQYKVHASRRDRPGMAEVHERDTDIVHVLEGTATIVTGGELVEGRVTAQDEIRGTSIRGGEVRALQPGDVLVIPDRTPHWFTEVNGPFLYYVVKVTRTVTP